MPLVIGALLSAACGAGPASTGKPPGETRPTDAGGAAASVPPPAASEDKIAFALRQRATAVAAAVAGLPGGLPNPALAEMSDDLVQVDETASLLAEVHAAQAVGDAERRDLESAGARIVTSTADLAWPTTHPPPAGLGVFAAWIPYDRLSEVAALPWVVAITPQEQFRPGG